MEIRSPKHPLRYFLQKFSNKNNIGWNEWMNRRSFSKKYFRSHLVHLGTLKSMYMLGTCATQYVIIIIILQKYYTRLGTWVIDRRSFSSSLDVNNTVNSSLWIDIWHVIKTIFRVPQISKESVRIILKTEGHIWNAERTGRNEPWYSGNPESWFLKCSVRAMLELELSFGANLEAYTT